MLQVAKRELMYTNIAEYQIYTHTVKLAKVSFLGTQKKLLCIEKALPKLYLLNEQC